MSEQTARLAASVSNISAALEQRATSDDLRASAQGQAAQIEALSQRMEALERAVTVRAESGEGGSATGSEVPIGQHVVRMYTAMRGINAELAKRASASSLAALEASVEARLRDQANAGLKERASAEQMRRLEQAHELLSSQIASVESACANKIDKARVAGLETTVSRLRDFAAFREASESRLESLEGAGRCTRQDLLERAAEAAEAERVIGDMRTRLREDTPRLADLTVLEDKVRVGSRVRDVRTCPCRGRRPHPR